MNIAKIKTFAVRIPFKKGTKTETSTWGDRRLPVANTLFVKVTTDRGLQDWAGAFGLRAVASTRFAADELPGEKFHQDEAPAPLNRQESVAKLPSDTPSNRSGVRVRSFMLAFVGMLCATFIGFVSEIRPLNPYSPDHGYDEALGTQTFSLSSANFSANGSDEGTATFGGAKGGRERLGVRATVGCVDASSTANFHIKTIGGDHVD